jgi:hypothetical protein
MLSKEQTEQNLSLESKFQIYLCLLSKSASAINPKIQNSHNKRCSHRLWWCDRTCRFRAPSEVSPAFFSLPETAMLLCFRNVVQRSSSVLELWCGGSPEFSWSTSSVFLVLFSVLGMVGRGFGLRVVVLVLPSFCFLEVSSLVCQRRR